MGGGGRYATKSSVESEGEEVREWKGSLRSGLHMTDVESIGLARRQGLRFAEPCAARQGFGDLHGSDIQRGHPPLGEGFSLKRVKAEKYLSTATGKSSQKGKSWGGQ